LHLCQSFIEKLKQYKLDEENFYKFPMSDQVTYSYYIGRLELFNSNFLNVIIIYIFIYIYIYIN